MVTTSLVQDVEDALRAQRPELADRFVAQFDRSSCKSDESTIKALNNHFRLILAQSKLQTMDERGCLRDELSPGMWFKYFKSHVLPTLVRFNLPPE